MINTRETIKDILQTLHPDVDFEQEKAIAESGLLDSLDIASLVAQMRARLNVKVTADKIVPENFSSLDSICALAESLRT